MGAAPLALATGGLSLIMQDRQAKAANEAAEATYKVEAARARNEALERQNVMTQDAQEKAQQVNQERENLAREALRSRASARVGSAESGVGGVSKVRSFLATEAQLADSEFDISTTEANQQFGLQTDARNITNAFNDRIQNARTAFNNSTRRRVGALDVATALLPAAGGLFKPSGAPSGNLTGKSMNVSPSANTSRRVPHIFN